MPCSRRPPIIYTHTDEAPLLATYSFLPIIQAYAGQAGVEVETRDISLAGRIIAQFPERLTDEQRLDDALAELGELAKRPEANIIKLPNISASIPQLKAAIAELQSQGFDLPDYPDDPSDRRGEGRPRPLRQGQGQRGQPGAARGQLRPPRRRVGQAATPASTRTRWAPGAPTRRPTSRPWAQHDFRSNEKSVVIERDDTLRIEHVADDGTVTVLKDARAGARRRDRRRHRHAGRRACTPSSPTQIARAKAEDVLFSVHLKATMMKVSDPIIFGHVVTRVLPRGLRRVRRAARRRGARARTTASAASWPGLDALENGAEIKAAFDAGDRRRARAGDGRLRPGHHQPARARPT